MSENTSGEQNSSNTSSSQSQKDLANELRELGLQLEQTFRTVIESEQAKALKENLVLGFQEIGKQVQAGLKQLQENPKVQELADRGQQAVSQAQQSQAFKDFQETLISGLGQLNERLSALVTKLEERSAQAANSTPSEAGSQNVPVDDESQPPATGETTRL
jgi:hypothetical protein